MLHTPIFEGCLRRFHPSNSTALSFSCRFTSKLLIVGRCAAAKHFPQPQRPKLGGWRQPKRKKTDSLSRTLCSSTAGSVAVARTTLHVLLTVMSLFVDRRRRSIALCAAPLPAEPSHVTICRHLPSNASHVTKQKSPEKQPGTAPHYSSNGKECCMHSGQLPLLRAAYEPLGFIFCLGVRQGTKPFAPDFRLLCTDPAMVWR